MLLQAPAADLTELARNKNNIIATNNSRKKLVLELFLPLLSTVAGAIRGSLGF